MKTIKIDCLIVSVVLAAQSVYCGVARGETFPTTSSEEARTIPAVYAEERQEAWEQWVDSKGDLESLMRNSQGLNDRVIAQPDDVWVDAKEQEFMDIGNLNLSIDSPENPDESQPRVPLDFNGEYSVDWMEDKDQDEVLEDGARVRGSAELTDSQDSFSMLGLDGVSAAQPLSEETLSAVSSTQSEGFDSNYGSQESAELNTEKNPRGLAEALGLTAEAKILLNSGLEQGLSAQEEAVNLDSVNRLDATRWTGVPAPEFGIQETVHMYLLQEGQSCQSHPAKCFDYGQGLEPYHLNELGMPYTHRVDRSNPDLCRDAGSGSPGAPRCTIPTTLSPGSIVDVYGGPYTLNLQGTTGTSEKPIFIRGVNAVIQGVGPLRGVSYVILENLKFDGKGLRIPQNTHHVAVRHSEITNKPAPPFCEDKQLACSFSAVNTIGSDGTWKEGESASHIVFYRNHIHNNGEYPPTYETGTHGIIVHNGSENIWILENEIDHNAEDGIQIWGTGVKEHGPYAHHVYISGNKIHHNGENAIDIKQSHDIIVSNNEIYGYRATRFPKSGSDGAAVVLNNDEPNTHLWVIGNHIYDSALGIRSQSKGENYILDNFIHDIRHSDRQQAPSSIGDGSGVALWAAGAAHLRIVGNRFQDVDAGIHIFQGKEYTVQRNFFGRLNEPNTYHLAINTGIDSLVSHVSDNLFYDPRSENRLTRGNFSCDSCVFQDARLDIEGRPTISGSPLEGIFESLEYQRFLDTYGLELGPGELVGDDSEPEPPVILPPKPVNQPPVFTLIPQPAPGQEARVLAGTLGEEIVFRVSGSDPDAEPGDGGLRLWIDPTTHKSGMTFTEGFFRWTPQPDQTGVHEVRFLIEDRGEPPLSAAQSVIFHVSPVLAPRVPDEASQDPPTEVINEAPIIVSDPIIEPGSSEVSLDPLSGDFRFRVHAMDPEGDALTYGAGNLPRGISFDSLSGYFSWKPDWEQDNGYVFTAWVYDGQRYSFKNFSIRGFGKRKKDLE